MMVATVVDRRSELGALVLDVIVTEEVRVEAEVTQYPTEEGVLISDHVTQGAKTLRIAGVIATADVGAFSFGAGGEPKVVDVMETIYRMHAERALLTIATSQMQYPDYAFSSLTATRTNGPDGGNFMSIAAEATHIRKVGLKTADVPAESVRASDPAAGRAGETNKPAGRTSSSTSGGASGKSGSSATSPAAGADARGKSMAATLKDALSAAGGK